jgi:RNA polymerase sigma-70 factor (ECF subfamily)
VIAAQCHARCHLSDDESHLLTRVAAGDQSALSILIARQQGRIYRFALRRVRNEAVAEEITNDVFAEVWRTAGSFEGRASVSTWLLSIAHNKAVSSLRKRREESWDEDAAGTLADDSDDPETALQKTDKSTVMRRCLAGLSAEHREIIDLVYYHEQSVAEVSAVLGIPEATVKTRMFYARKKLSELLQAAGVDRGWP